MIVCDDMYPKILDEILDFLTKSDIELLFVKEDDMKEINFKNRGIDKATDVLSFPLHSFPHSYLGSIVINLDLAAKMSDELGHSLDDEIALLFTHGLLHILGFDHENDDGAMRRKEISIMECFDLPKSLISRNLV